MSSKILFVFEGAKTERQIFENLKKHYFPDSEGVSIVASYNANIYSLFK